MTTVNIFETALSATPERHDVTRDVFDREIRTAAKPIILRGLVKDWPAVAKALSSHEDIGAYLKAQANTGVTPTYIGPPEIEGRYFYRPDMKGFNFDKRDIPLPPTIDKLLSIKDDPHPIGVYAGATSTKNTLPDFNRDNAMPLVDGVEPLIWVGNSARIAPHFDADENIACVVSGKRRFVLFPPEQLENLYVGPLDFTMAGPPSSMVDPRAADLDAYPKYRFAIESAMIVELEPGDALYIPPLWWHYVESEGPLNVLVNYWWNDNAAGDIMSALGLAVLLLRELPDAERGHWRNIFDHYVFNDSAKSAIDHIPDAMRGMLGAPSPRRDEYMKAYLRSKMMETLR